LGIVWGEQLALHLINRSSAAHQAPASLVAPLKPERLP
jgi:hypothetical protein